MTSFVDSLYHRLFIPFEVTGKLHEINPEIFKETIW